MKNIRKVNTTYSTGDGTQTLVYYYLVMDKDNAAEYFTQYYNVNSNKEAIDRYFAKYASGGILLGDYDKEGNQYTILGNSLVSSALSDSGVTLLNGISPDAPKADPDDSDDSDAEDETADGTYEEVSENTGEMKNEKTEAEILAQASEISKEYSALTTNLTKDASTIAVDQNVFNSIIKETDLEDYLNDKGTDTVIFATDSGLKAVVTKKAEINLADIGNSSDIRLVISTGNVTVNRNYTGLVVAKGKITIDGSVSNGCAVIKRNKMELFKVLSALSGEEGDLITPLDMFVNGGGSMVNGAEEAEEDDAGNLKIDYTEIVRYVNWIKK